MSLPGVDLIVPCYNYGRYLRACTHSILQETRLPIRVLLIDDASTDASAETAREIAARDSRVEVIAHVSNRGHIATFNEGIAWLRAPYMLLLSADDLVAPGALVRAVSLMEAEPQVALVYGKAIQFRGADDNRSVADPTEADGPTVQSGVDFIRRLCSRPDNPVETAAAVVRTAVQRRVGGYRPELPHAGDLEMWLRCAAHGDVGFIPHVQAFTRIHDGNMRHAYTGARLSADYQQRWLAFELFFAAEGKRLDNAAELKRLARRALAEQALWAAARGFEETNDPGAVHLFRMARTIDPSIIRTGLWWKTLLRLTIGQRRWQALATCLSRLRTRRAPLQTPAGAGRRR